MNEHILPRRHTASPIRPIAGFRKLNIYPWTFLQKIEGVPEPTGGLVEIPISAPGLRSSIRKLELHYTFAHGNETAELWAEGDASEIWDLPAPHGELVLEVPPSHSWIVRVAPQTLIVAHFVRGW